MRGMSWVCGYIRAGDRGYLEVAADGADLLGQSREAHVGDELESLTERAGLIPGLLSLRCRSTCARGTDRFGRR